MWMQWSEEGETRRQAEISRQEQIQEEVM